jgi:predicted CXXCH cytochrome family protein
MMNETLNKNRIHWPLLDKTGCLNCHEPHASKQKKLLMTETRNLCGKCHSDNMGMQAKLAEMEKQERRRRRENDQRRSDP